MLMSKKAEKLGPSSEDFYLLAFLYMQLDEFDLALNSCHKAKKMGYEGKALLYATNSCVSFFTWPHRGR